MCQRREVKGAKGRRARYAGKVQEYWTLLSLGAERAAVVGDWGSLLAILAIRLSGREHRR